MTSTATVIGCCCCLCAAVDTSVSPGDGTPLLVAPARHVTSDDGDVLSTETETGLDVVSRSSRRTLFVALGVVLGVIFVVIFVLGFTCTLRHCRRLRHAGQFPSADAT